MNSVIKDLLKTIIGPELRSYLRSQASRSFGWNKEDWVRVVYSREWKTFIANLPLQSLKVLEISPGPRPIFGDPASVAYYRAVNFPAFDIAKDTLDEKFDLIIAEQVFEHLRHPYHAARNVYQMLNNNGVFLIATPFMLKVHGVPRDYTRWTPDGLRGFLEDCGFTCDVRSWGNKKAVKDNLIKWREYGWKRDLRNEPEFPATVWAYARKRQDDECPNRFETERNLLPSSASRPS